MEGIFQGGFRIRAGVVLLLYDDLTDRPAQEGLCRVRCRRPLKVVKKQGGILVFLDLPKEAFTIVLESPIYESRTLCIQPDEACQVKKLWMSPGIRYPVPQGAVRVTGRTEPETTVYVACDTGERLLYLLDDYRPADGSQIRLYGRSQPQLEGKQICLSSSKGEARCYLGAELEEGGGYRLSAPLSIEADKLGTRVIQVYSGRADREGYYQVLVRGPVERLIGWSRKKDGSEVRREYKAEGQGQEDRFEMDFL